MNVAKFNPFRPNNIVHPGMFVGRVDELNSIERCLFQTKNGNSQHFLVQGERGIGKSSLFYYVDLMAKGRVKDSHGDRFNFLTVSADLGACSTQLEIVRKIARGLRDALNEMDELKKTASQFWDWLTNWEVLGVQYHKDRGELDLEELAEDFVSRLAALVLQGQGNLDGVLFLLDEADHPPVEAGLGTYIKLITERLSRKGCNTVLFGLAGLPALLARLRDSHESSPRLFQTMLLAPLEFEERQSVVRSGLKEANLRNQVRTEIDEDAIDFLAELSEGYPHFLQQFAYSAFEHDSDDKIDEEDVGEGAYKEGGALSQLGDKFFNDMYHARISSQEYRRVLDAMADHGDSWVTRKQILSESGVSDSNVNNALASLKAKQIIIQDETRRGFYRLPTNSFAAWINAIRSARAKSDALKGAQFGG